MPVAVGKSGMSVEIVIYVRVSAAGETSGRNRRSVIHAPRARALAVAPRRAALEIARRRKPRARACAKVKARGETAKGERQPLTDGAATYVRLLTAARKNASRRQMRRHDGTAR